MSGLVYLKSADELDVMHQANCIVHNVINYVGEHIKPGVSTLYLDDLAEENIRKSGAKNTLKGYKGFPGSICISVNDEVVHGVPSEDNIIKDGDIVTLDLAVHYKGFAGDSAKTFVVGDISQKTLQLIKQTKKALYAGINEMHPGNHLHDIGKAVSAVAKENGYGLLENFCGHGIGKDMHEGPHVFNYINRMEPNILLREGMVFAIEPMFTLGSKDVKLLDDDWTVVTDDKSISCHWELSTAITKEGPRVLGIGWDN